MLNTASRKFATKAASTGNQQGKSFYLLTLKAFFFFFYLRQHSNILSYILDLIPFLPLALRTCQMFCFHKNLLKMFVLLTKTSLIKRSVWESNTVLTCRSGWQRHNGCFLSGTRWMKGPRGTHLPRLKKTSHCHWTGKWNSIGSL